MTLRTGGASNIQSESPFFSERSNNTIRDAWEKRIEENLARYEEAPKHDS